MGKCDILGDVDAGGVCNHWSAAEESYFVHFAKGADAADPLSDSLFFPFGVFYRGGKREFTRADGEEMVRNFKANILGRDNGYLPVNREHKPEHGRLAWIADLWVADDGVHGRLQPVPKQEQAVMGFDYLSPEIKWDWTHPYTGEKHRNVLFGAALTNYPYLLGKTSVNHIWTEKGEWEDAEQYASFTPPDSVQSNAKRGLELRQKWGRGGLSTQEAGKQGIGSGVARATTLANGKDVSLDTVKKMHAFFSRHEKNKGGKDEDGGPSAGAIAWLLWGGDAGRAWARSVLNKQEDMAEPQEIEPIEGAFVHHVPLGMADTQKRIVYGVVFQPDEPDGEGHVLCAEDIEAACHGFMEFVQFGDGDASLDAHHRRPVMSGEARIVECWIQREPVAWEFGERSTQVLPGSWCMGVKILSDELWAEVESGEITGFSPKGWGLLSRLEGYGGPGSGHWGHSGRPGQIGGSSKGGGVATIPWASEAVADIPFSSIDEIDKQDEQINGDFGLLDWNASRADGFIDSGKVYRVFHATPIENVESIAETGLRSPQGVRPARWFMTTTSIESAKSFGTRPGSVMIEYRIPSSEVNAYLWKGVYSRSYDDVQRGIREPLPGKYIHAVHNISADEFHPN